VCRFLARVLASETNAEADAAAVKLFVGAISVAGLGMYVAASIAGAGMGLSHIVSVAMLNLVAAALLLVGGTLGWETFARAMAEAAWVQRGLRYIESGYEWCVALVICVGVLPLLAYALLLAGKQATRWLRGSSKASRGGIVTAETHERLTKLSVHWGSVCSKVALLCQGYLCMSVVVAKFVVVFLCWLSAVLAGLPLGLVVLLFLLQGIVLFLVPVIPGIPVYVCSGVLLTGAVMSEEELADPTPHAPPSYWLGVALAVSVACLLKFCAIVLQQQVIGRWMGSRIEIRAACQTNSSFIRAARFVLTQRGCTFGKTVVLCGGPDWPTSVLTGILGLSCPKMLFGSIPVVLLILPSTAMGSALIMANRPGWDLAASAMTMAMLATQMGASVGFVAVIEHAATAYEAEIAALPIDEEVAALDEARALYATAWRNASDWRDASYPAAARVLAVTAAAAGLVGCHLSVLAACFARVTVADRFDAPPISGNPLNVVRGGAGYALLASFLGGLLLLLLHRAWLGRRTRARLVVEEAAVARRGPDKAMAPKGAAEAPVLEQGKVWGVHY